MAHPALPKEVAEALAHTDVAGLHALAQQPDKQLRKGAKRALHLLKARGVSVAEPEPSRARAPPAPSVEPMHELGRLTAFDDAGERLFFLPEKASIGFTLHVGVLSDADRLVDLRALQLSRRQLKGYFNDLPAGTLAESWESTAEEVAAAIRPALEQATGPLRQPAHALLTTLPSSASRAREGVDPAALASSAALFETSVFERSFPERDVLGPLSQKIEEVAMSPLYVDEAQRLAQIRRVMERATTDYFTAERRQRFSRRAQAASELFEQRGNRENSSRAWAVSNALLEERDVLTIPFARAFFERLLPAQAPKPELDQPESRLIVTSSR